MSLYGGGGGHGPVSNPYGHGPPPHMMGGAPMGGGHYPMGASGYPGHGMGAQIPQAQHGYGGYPQPGINPGYGVAPGNPPAQPAGYGHPGVPAGYPVGNPFQQQGHPNPLPQQHGHPNTAHQHQGNPFQQGNPYQQPQGYNFQQQQGGGYR